MNEKKFNPDLKVSGNISNLFVRQSKCRENGQFVIGFGITRSGSTVSFIDNKSDRNKKNLFELNSVLICLRILFDEIIDFIRWYN